MVEAVASRTTKKAKIYSADDLLNSKYFGMVFEALPDQAALNKVEGWGGVYVPPKPFILAGASIYKIGERFSVHKLDLMEETGLLDAYIHPGLKFKRLRKKVEALEKRAEEALIRATAGRLFKNVVSRTYEPKGEHKPRCGTDPEIFAAKADGTLIPAFEFLGPKPKSMAPAMYWDGYQAEFTVDHSHCNAYFVDYIQNKLSDMQRVLVEKTGDKSASLTLKNTFDIPMERLYTDDKKYVDFGCHPSKSAYGEEPIHVKGRDVPFRSAGGHIHLGVNKLTDEQYIKLAKTLDKTLGVLSVAMFQYYDDPRRRLFYGRAGEFRTPPHGIEWRVLSNAWLCHPAITHFVFEIARLITQVGIEDKSEIVDWNMTEDEVRECINNCNVDLAKSLIERNRIQVMALLAKTPAVSYGPIEGVKFWYDMVVNGVHKYLKNPDKLSERWCLDKGWVGHSDGKCANMSSTTASVSRNNYKPLIDL